MSRLLINTLPGNTTGTAAALAEQLLVLVSVQMSPPLVVALAVLTMEAYSVLAGSTVKTTLKVTVFCDVVVVRSCGTDTSIIRVPGSNTPLVKPPHAAPETQVHVPLETPLGRLSCNRMGLATGTVDDALVSVIW